MQSGKIKHWNEDKGYGFIEVDNQSEEVFFHISKTRLSQPIAVGQRVHFNSERNDKNQLRATEVTPNSLSIVEDSNSTQSNNSANRANQNSQNNPHSYKNKSNNRSRSNKKSPLSTLFSLVAIIAVAIYLFADLPDRFFTNDLQATTAQTSNVSNSTTKFDQVKSITGDAQIDNTIALIQQGGPFPYPNKDGTTFGNRENRLPAQSRGYYREYTVPTPGVSHRGPRRIVTGGNPPKVYYLTINHYDSFSKLEVN